MGIKERQERDREAVRRAILDAARDLFVAEGYDNVSIRKIAERIEYSPAAIYGYFPSKDDIFFALAEEGFRLLGDPGLGEAQQRLQTLPTPLERVRALFWRLYEFSRQHPEYFALMFVDRSVPRISREYERFAFARETKRHIAEEIQRSVDAGELPASVKPIIAMRMLTSGVLGIAVMRLSDRLPPGENADDIASDVLDTILAGLRSGIAFKSRGVDTDCGNASVAETAVVPAVRPASSRSR
jgi:AcrR family transcriptional regulator